MLMMTILFPTTNYPVKTVTCRSHFPSKIQIQRLRVHSSNFISVHDVMAVSRSSSSSHGSRPCCWRTERGHSVMVSSVHCSLSLRQQPARPPAPQPHCTQPTALWTVTARTNNETRAFCDSLLSKLKPITILWRDTVSKIEILNVILCTIVNF